MNDLGKHLKKVDFTLIGVVLLGSVFGAIAAINHHPNGAQLVKLLIAS